MHISYWEEVKKSTFGKIGIGMITVVVGVALLAPVIAPHDPWSYMGATLEPPSSSHFLGLNDTGQDIFSELIYGTRTTLITAVSIAIFSTVISLALGILSALKGGMIERFILRLIDVMLIIPVFLIAILAASFFRPGIILMIILLSVLLWPPGARIIRMQCLTILQSQHLTAAKNFGASTGYLIYKHLIPDLYPIIAANFIGVIRRAVFMEAGLAFLGVFDPALKSWGLMIHYARDYIFTGAWAWWLLPAGLAISFTILGFALVGYALESILDPRLRRQS